MLAYSTSFFAAAPAAARRLEVADLGWATDLLVAALAGHPALRYVCDGPAAPARHTWLVRQLLECAVRCGSAYANAAGTAAVLWLGPDLSAAAWHLRLRVLPAAAWHLGWAGSRRLQRLLRTQAWLRHQNLSGPHHLLLALGVPPAARGAGEGRRLLSATLALRQASGLPCYFSLQVPTQLPFYQSYGFGLAGHCPVGTGPAGPLSTWGLLWTSPITG